MKEACPGPLSRGVDGCEHRPGPPGQALAGGQRLPLPSPLIPQLRPVSTSAAESEEAEVAVALVPGEVEELKVAVGLRGEGQVELDAAVPVYSGLRVLVLPVHPEAAEGRAPPQKGEEGGPQHVPSCHPLPLGF